MEQVNTLGGRYIREAKVYAKKNEDSKILMIFSLFCFFSLILEANITFRQCFFYLKKDFEKI